MEAVTDRIFDLRVHQMVQRWWRDVEKSLRPSCLETNLSDVRKRKQARKEEHEPVAAARAAAKDASIVQWTAAADKAIAELSWRQKKDLALIKFAAVYEESRSKMEAYRVAAAEPSIDVTAQTVSNWMADYDANDGFFSKSMWGKNASVPWLLVDEDIQLDCKAWIANHSPKKGVPNFTALDFLHWLIGDNRMNPPTTGYLNSVGPNGERAISNCDASAITERTANSYLHRLGAEYRALKRGTFSDRHEDFADDRVDRYLPMEADFFQRGPNFWQDSNGEWQSVDLIKDVETAPKVLYNVLGGDGVVRKIDFGGRFKPGLIGKYIMFYVHDESCFDAGEQQKSGWLLKGVQVCMDKGRGPKRHISARMCRHGNGTLDSDPDGAPGMIELDELEAWYKKEIAGLNPPLPKYTDVAMDPGSSPGKQGWWLGKQFRMQELLCIKTFNKIFRAIVPEGYVLTVPIEQVPMEFEMVDQLDWSQGHAELPKDALDATVMTCKQGGAHAHLRHTFWTQPSGELPMPRATECEPGCAECRASYAQHGQKPGYQSVGRKGLYILMAERGVKNPKKIKMEELVKTLQSHSDFKPKMSAENSMVYELMQDHGHFAFFGVKYHAELAAIERKWMHMKRSVRGFMTGQLQLLKDMLDIHWGEYTVIAARKDMRHCRDTAAVYWQLGIDADLTKLEAGQKEYTSHRRVFDGATNLLKALSAPEDMTEKQLQRVATLKKVRSQQEEHKIDISNAESDFQSKKRRRDHIEKKNKLGITEDKRKGNGKGGKNVTANLKDKE